jgi:hypothetical protein
MSPGRSFKGFSAPQPRSSGHILFKERINRGGEAHVLMNERATLYRRSAALKEETTDAGPHFINTTQMVSGNLACSRFG